nr:alpha-amylase family glycosyl hydrolase [Paracoccus shandongensis]
MEDRPTTGAPLFGGPAWTYHPGVGRYVFTLFSPQQPDLNWQNPALRRAVYDMMRWWLDRGVRGFRMDVIDLIGKDIDRDLIAEGPCLHGFLQEMHREVLAGRDVVTVGESWNVTTDSALLYCGRGRGNWTCCSSSSTSSLAGTRSMASGAPIRWIWWVSRRSGPTGNGRWRGTAGTRCF